MAQKVVVNVDSPNDILESDAYGAGALVRLERSTLPDSGFAEILTEPVVADVAQYELWDASGSSSHYYRTRYSSSSGGVSSEYSDSFRAGALLSYATIEDAAETMNISVNDTRAYNTLADLLVAASDLVTQTCGRSFFRDPQVSGTTERIYHVTRQGKRSLTDATGRTVDIVSLTSMELADTLDSAYSTVAAGSTGYYLHPHVATSGIPYSDLELSPIGSPTYYPLGGLVKLTGVFGFAAVPPLVRRATIDIARDWYRAALGGDGPIGEVSEDFSLARTGMPPSFYRLRESDYKYRRPMYVI